MFKKVVLDIESNNLLANMLSYATMPYTLKPTAKLHVVMVTCVDTRNSFAFIPKEFMSYKAPVTKIESYFDEIKSCLAERIVPDQDGILYNSIKKVVLTKQNLEKFFKKFEPEELIFHNGIKFDMPALQLFNMIEYEVGYPDTGGSKYKTVSKVFGEPIIFTDTLLWSKLLNPDRIFGHGLGAWGKQIGNYKGDFHEFENYSYKMVTYCLQDTLVNIDIYNILESEKDGWAWDKAYAMEIKLADITLKQELFGFEYDTEKAKDCLVKFDKVLHDIEEFVNPILPDKRLNKGEQKVYTLPKRQFKADGSVSAIMLKFAEKHGGELTSDNIYIFEGKEYQLPYEGCIKQTTTATIKDLDHLKSYLITLGWDPFEWKERDVTKDAKKQKLHPNKVIEVIDRYVESTLNGPFRESRLALLKSKPQSLKYDLMAKYRQSPNKPLRVPTGPCLRVGTEKVICPNLEKIGADAEFVGAVNKYLTYKHRRASIAGGSEDESGEPLTGYLSMVREDGRVPTPADTIGASTGRYKHSGVDFTSPLKIILIAGNS